MIVKIPTNIIKASLYNAKKSLFEIKLSTDDITQLSDEDKEILFARHEVIKSLDLIEYYENNNDEDVDK